MDNETENSSPALKQCRFCGEMIEASAPKCRYCGEELYERYEEEGEDGFSSGARREGRLLVMRTDRETVLPDRCVKCNNPSDGGFLRRRLYWHHPLWYLLLLGAPFWCIGGILYVIVGLIVRKKADIQIGLCRRHRIRRHYGIAISWIAFAAGIAMFILGITGGDPWLGPVAGIMMLTGAVVGTIMDRVVEATRITNTTIWIKGVCHEYLNELPEILR